MFILRYDKRNPAFIGGYLILMDSLLIMEILQEILMEISYDRRDYNIKIISYSFFFWKSKDILKFILHSQQLSNFILQWYKHHAIILFKDATIIRAFRIPVFSFNSFAK